MLQPLEYGTNKGYLLSRKTVQHHNTLNDAWVIFDDGVYDITMFLEKHPGGIEVLKDHLGKDVSQAMRSASTHSHSPFAFQLLEKYHIGISTVPFTCPYLIFRLFTRKGKRRNFRCKYQSKNRKTICELEQSNFTSSWGFGGRL